jgi:mRNA interferase RelE/StbE
LIVKLTSDAEKDLAGMDPYVAGKLLNFLETHIPALDNPRSEGRALSGKWSGYWRYRHGKYRIICDILDQESVIIAIKIGPRDSIYD